MSFENLGLSAALVRAVHDQGYTSPTPIQEQAIPVVLRGGDLMAAAQTGTGKTAGFALPVLDRLGSRAPGGKSRPIRALVLAPTRELAAQVHESFRTYGRHLALKSTMICGGVGMNPQVQAVRRGVDILVATPGRLLDHMRRGTVDLSSVEILVLDEADRMLDMGFIHDIRKVMAEMPSQRQSLLFSATFSPEIRKLANSLLRQPETIEVASRNRAADTVTQRVHPVDQGRKRALLSHLISENGWHQVLVFARTKHGSDRLAKQLEQDGLTSAAIHGNKSQGARTRTLARFKQGRVQVLVATDIAARGLDIDHLPHVVNYDLPNVAEDYVHRIGRTGRAGKEGAAVSLVSGEEKGMLRNIEKLLKRNIESRVITGFEPQHNGRSNSGRGNGNRGRGNGSNDAPRRGGPKPAGKRRQPSRVAGSGRGGNDAPRRRARPAG